MTHWCLSWLRYVVNLTRPIKEGKSHDGDLQSCSQCSWYYILGKYLSIQCLVAVKATEWRGGGAGGHLSPLKSDLDLCCSSCTQCLTWGPVVSRQGRTFHPRSKNTPYDNIFSYSQASSRHCCCAMCGQISAVSIQVCGQQRTRGYDLKCHKELFYIKGREKEDDYGYTEPDSQRDLQSLVWSQSDCETQSIKRIITQDITMVPLHSLMHAFEEIYVSLAWLLCLCVSLMEFTCLHGFVCASVWKCGRLCTESSEIDVLRAWH